MYVCIVYVGSGSAQQSRQHIIRREHWGTADLAGVELGE